jgi:ureidoacrylate peracid hydrolase
VRFDRQTTALLVIDPYNDFISPGGRIWERVKTVAEANNCVPNMLEVLTTARRYGLRVFYALHHRYRPGDYDTWKYIAPIQQAAARSQVFGEGTWGGEIRTEFAPLPGEVVAQEHWCSSGFANTDLDQQLKVRGVHRLIAVGLLANTCVEATVRFGAELGYEVTVVRDAVAGYSDAEMHAALDVNIPNYACAVLTTSEVVAAIAASADVRTAPEVYEHHTHAMINGDLDEIVSDYAEDAVFITPTGVLRGREGVRKGFTRIFRELPDPQWHVHTRVLDGDMLFLEWTAQSDGARAEDGVETLLVRDGAIALQTVHYTVQPVASLERT